MSILAAHNLAKYYGAQDVFAGVTFSIAHGDKVALVGPNGAGKTTLLRIILGLDEPTEGEVSRARGLRMGYLPQQPTLDSDARVIGEMEAVFSELRRQQAALQRLADEMASADNVQEAMDRYAQAEARFEQAGGYEYENRIKRVLGGLGFSEEMFEWPIAMLSGGQVTRAYLARLLLQEPELLVLDEPTNYLDLQALEWLESYLAAWPGSILIVSHDRYFLDHVVTRVWELNHNQLETYRGNYSHYVEQRKARRQRRWREFKAQQAHIARTEDFIRRYKAGQRSKEARGRLKRLNRLERITPPPTDHAINLRLSTQLRSGDKVLMSEGAVIGFPSRPEAELGSQEDTGPHPLFELPEVLIQRGERVVLLGPNGCGKTTFLRTLLDQMEPLSGHIRLGASVRIGYLPQKRDWLDYDKTVLEQILDYSDMTVEQARTLMGRFLFTGDEVYKLIGNLSGGEMTRVALAILTMRGANVLLLDEPTTHLDVESQEILQSVLLTFPGTILLVSHDRYLIDALADWLWIVKDGRVSLFEGNYTAYTTSLRAPMIDPTSPETKRDDRSGYRAERRAQAAARRQRERVESLESEIAEIEQRIASTASLLDLASQRKDLAEVQSLGQAYRQLEGDLAQRMREWEALAHEHV